jgi:hypothetical protein
VVVARRRLPLLQPASQGQSDEPARPAWQWVGFGAVAIFGAWVPLSALAGALGAALLARASDPTAMRRAALLASSAYALELAAGALAGGYLVGRWGPAGVGLRQALLSGVSAAVLLVAATWVSSGPSVGMVVVAALAPLMAVLGAALGLRARRAA